MYNAIMVNPLTWLSKRRFPYEPLITVEISRSAILHNLREFKKIAPHGQVAPVLKSNAYGHGFKEVASILRHEKDIPFFVVDSFFEAVALHRAGIKSEIVIIGFSRPETILRSRLNNAVFTVSSLDILRDLEDSDRQIPIHLKIDTGMRRQGILPSEIDKAIELLAKNPLIELRGISSHLSDADNRDPSFTDGQINVWNKIARRFKSDFPSLKHIHLSATEGHRYDGDIEANVSRLGIGLYGLVDGSKFMPKLNLRPALTMKTIVTGIKDLKRDETVGYNNTYKAMKDMKIATIPAGYFEGIDRRLSNIGTIGIHSDNLPCPIVGRISMNIASIDVTDKDDVKIGDEAIIISADPLSKNSLMSMAALAKTITYELAVHIPAQLRRIVVD